MRTVKGGRICRGMKREQGALITWSKTLLFLCSLPCMEKGRSLHQAVTVAILIFGGPSSLLRTPLSCTGFSFYWRETIPFTPTLSSASTSSKTPSSPTPTAKVRSNFAVGSLCLHMLLWHINWRWISDPVVSIVKSWVLLMGDFRRLWNYKVGNSFL